MYQTEALANDPSIKIIESAPYDKLLPLVKAAVHHGGIGTITSCLLAGKPFLSCPVLFPLGDQYFWGMIGYRKGLSPKPIALKKLTTALLISKTKELLETKSYYIRSEELMHAIRDEDGPGNAVSLIERL